MWYLRQPVVFLSTREVCSFSLWSSLWGAPPHPECGMITALVSTHSASLTIVIFTASHDDRFHRTPEGGGGRTSREHQRTLEYIGEKLRTQENWLRTEKVVHAKKYMKWKYMY